MESFFFNAGRQRYKVTDIIKGEQSFIQRVDISNGMVYIESKSYAKKGAIKIKNIDRMVMIIMTLKGKVVITEHYTENKESIEEGNISIFCSSKQDLTFDFYKTEGSDVFILFVADFFLKRYLSQDKKQPIDFLCNKIEQDISLERINTQPIDALTLYIVNNLLSISKKEIAMQSIRAEHTAIDFMLHRFSLIDIFSNLSAEELTIASKAKDILLKDFINPPDIETLAKMCATNSSKLKLIFKKAYKTTIHRYIQKLRLEEANLLLKEDYLSIGEIAKMVGYTHQGYFSKLFFRTFGVYPKDIKCNLSC